MRTFFLCFLISVSVFAQDNPEDFFESRIIEIGPTYSFSIGSYVESLKSTNSGANPFGISGSYLINPFRSKEGLSVIFMGPEFVYESLRQNTFNAPGETDGIFARHSSFSLRAKVKYVPILVSKKFLPSLSFSMGPRRFSSKLMETVGEEQIQKIDGISGTVLNYALEAGVEIRRSANQKKFIKLSAAYDLSNAVKTWDRDKLGFDNQFNIISPVKVVVPRSIVIKLQLINYR